MGFLRWFFAAGLVLLPIEHLFKDQVRSIQLRGRQHQVDLTAAVPVSDGRIEQSEGLGFLLERPILRSGHGEYPDVAGVL